VGGFDVASTISKTLIYYAEIRMLSMPVQRIDKVRQDGIIRRLFLREKK